MKNNQLDVELSMCKIQYFADQKEFLKLKGSFRNIPPNSKREQFLIQIQIQEIGKSSNRFNFNDTNKQWIQAKKKKTKNDPYNNNQNQVQRLIVTWEIPIDHNFFSCHFTRQNLEFSNKITLLLKQKVSEEIKMNSYEIEMKKIYFAQKNIADNIYNQNIEHYLTLERPKKIPIKICFFQTLFKQNQSIEFRLEGNFSGSPLPQFTAILTQKILFKGINLGETTLIQNFKVDRKKNDERNNFIICFQEKIPNDNQIAPLFLGSQIQCYHLIMIQITFQKTSCLDWNQRVFYIKIPIEIITQDQEVPIQQENQNDYIEQFNIKDQQKEKQIVLEGGKIKGFFYPQYTDCYRKYLKVEIVKNN
ncbi:unnamed protein product [Paramecium sonneborni]|uniref:Uncharacterized protein n=1 Tax=Paramecium sonneborni TaxID=65129 RepID=A0A8S1JZI0_9CILI|nr:unnamed protein product [Paramecium sonneborni]